jgi:hypothetical protein
MRTLTIIATLSIAPLTHASPTTQSCLGDLDTFLTCPAPAQRSGTECRVKEPRRGQAPGEHWSGSKRQGPAIFLRADGKTVVFAASYRDHKKTGRIYRFDAQGRLASLSDVTANKLHGVSATCLPDGRVSHLAHYQNDKVVGVSRAWRTKDGALAYAMDHSSGKPVSIAPTPEMQKRPDHLCQPQRCDVSIAPDLSGLPAPSPPQ